jgi:hypothetical protein
MLGNKQLTDVPGDLREFAFNSALKIKKFMLDLLDTQVGLLIILIIAGILLHYILRYFIGLKLGSEQFINKNKNKNKNKNNKSVN